MRIQSQSSARAPCSLGAPIGWRVAFKLACGDGESIQWRFDLEGFALALSGGFLVE
jgi:hypothetical protein